MSWAPAAMMALAGPALLGLATSALGEATLTGAVVLWAEPLLFLLGVHLVLWMLWENHWATAATTAAGFLLGGVALRRPPVPTAVQDLEPEWAERMHACSAQPADRRVPVRVLSWTLDPALPAPSVHSIAAQNADIIVLHGLNEPDRAEQLAARMGGEALFLPGAHTKAGLAVVVRGKFQYCGGQEESWTVPLGEPGGGGRAVLTFPEVEGVGVLPFIAVRMPRPGNLTGWTRWPAELQSGAQSVAALARALGSGRVILTGDFGVPRTFRKTAGTLLGAGLHELPVPPSWPHRLGPLPGLPLHALDRAWTGDDWELNSTMAVDMGDLPRRPIVTELMPNAGTAR